MGLLSRLPFAGRCVQSLRVAASLWHILSLLAIYALAATLQAPSLGCIAVFAALFFLIVPYSDSLQVHKDYLAMPFLTAGAAILCGSDSRWTPLLGGLCLGIAPLFKPTLLLECLVIAAVSAQGLLGPPLCWIVAGVLAPSAVLTVAAWIQGGLATFAFSNSPVRLLSYDRHTRRRWSPSTPAYDPFVGSRRPALAEYAAMLLPLMLASCVAVCQAPWPGDPPSRVVRAWLAASVLGIVFQRRYYFSHVAPCLPPMVILAATGVNGVFRQPAGPSLLVWGIALLTVGTSVAVLLPYLLMSPARWQRRLYARLGHVAVIALSAVEAIARRLAPLTQEEDRILPFGHHLQIALVAQRRVPLEYCVTGSLSAFALRGFLGDGWEEELLASMRQTPPRYIVDTDGGLDVQAISVRSGLQYELVECAFGLFPVYRLSGAAAPMAAGTTPPPLWKGDAKRLDKIHSAAREVCSGRLGEWAEVISEIDGELGI